MKLGLDLDVFQVLDQLGNLAGGYSIPLVHQFSGYRVPNPKIAVLVLLPEIGTQFFSPALRQRRRRVCTESLRDTGTHPCLLVFHLQHVT